MKAKSYSQLSSSDGHKSKSKEKLSQNLKLNSISSALGNLKNEPYSYLNVKASEVKTSRSKGHKTTRSPANQHKKKGPHSINTIYKLLCEKVKILVITSQKLFEKNQRIKEYERKKMAELEAREREIAAREQNFTQKNPVKNIHKPEFDEPFDYKMTNECKDMVSSPAYFTAVLSRNLDLVLF